MVTGDGLVNPILNSPYEAPARHFVLGPEGPTGEIKDGRRPSESFIAVPTKRRSAPEAVEELTLDFDLTGERRQVNDLVNNVRTQVDRWRALNYPRVTPVSRNLMLHWADAHRENRVMFCQREAVETAIFLAEVAGRSGYPDFRKELDRHNADHNDGLHRVALKMATGTGKTVVMAMLIVWQACNKAHRPRDSRFTNRFVIVAPGITIRDRLRVLHPSEDGNYYTLRGLVPPEMWSGLEQAAITITNYHAFLPKDAKEIQGVASTTRKLLTAGKQVDPFKETEAQTVARVLRDLGGRGTGDVVVFNDEAHHCYVDKPLETSDQTVLKGQEKKEAKDRNEGARVWFKGVRAIAQQVGVKAIYDLSATPFYLGGSGYQEGYIFPWVVSDFSLLDAIESGIVKVPRVPVDDDTDPKDLPTYLTLWEHVGPQLPKKGRAKAKADSDWVPPKELEGALRSLYRSYAMRYAHWETTLAPHGEPPPVFIVVCPNTVVSKLVHDWLAGMEIERDDGTTVWRNGKLPLLSNVEDGTPVGRPRTILIDSAQLESGEAMQADFKKAAAQEIEVFKREYRRRHPGADADAISDEDLLREVMNTVGKPGRLGEQVRCVVSVSMLTEGWDANTVSHILGIRRFGSQLLCEQVVGRGLRRRSYALNEDDQFDPEYAEIYGVPFAFMPSTNAPAAPPPSRPAIEVRALPERAEMRIAFPKVEGYRIEFPDAPVHFDADQAEHLHVDRDTIATWTETAGLAGTTDEQELAIVRNARPQQVVFEIAAEVHRRYLSGDNPPWLFPQLVDVTRRWLDPDAGLVSFADGTPLGVLLLTQPKVRAAEAILAALTSYPGARKESLRPILRRFDGDGSTDDVWFVTRKAVIDAHKSPVNHVVLDGPKGNTWEEQVADILERLPDVATFVKNDHLDFAIPYLYEGQTLRYEPDFLVRLTRQDGDPVETRTLIVEVSGGRKSAHHPDKTAAKATTARDVWCTAVNNHGGYGRWGYIELTDMLTAESQLIEAIDLLRADAPITGDPDRADHDVLTIGGP